MQELLTFTYEQLPQLADKMLEQIYLVALSVISAILLGVLLGIWVTYYKRWKSIVLGAASVLQTIPSLALLVFLLPFLGIGLFPALVTLAAYALLPIVRNTVTGIESIPPVLLMAADGLGFTRWQRLRLVEFPLAIPVIVAGIRTAVSMGVGIATLAAFVGAGGLGDFIYQGLVLNNTHLVLLGAIPAALMALLLDYMIAKLQHRIERRVYEKRTQSNRKYLRFIAILTLIVIAFFAIGKFVSNTFNQKENILRIGTKNSTEQLILGELMAQIINKKTQLKIERRFNLGNTAICQQALLKNEIDLYPEYTGTAYMVVLHKTAVLPANDIYNYVQQDYIKRFDLEWLLAFGFDNTQAVIVRQDFAAGRHLSTISDLKPLANKLAVGVQAAFLQRTDAYPQLRKIYNLRFKSVRIMNSALMYEALKNKQVDLVLGDATDGRITSYKLQILNDNKHAFPAYYAAPIVRAAFLRQHPAVADALKLLAGKINNKIMQKLNKQVDIDKKSPAEVAHEFLRQQGFLQA